MNRIDFDTRLVILATCTFLIVYVFTFPMGWLISDVYSYMNQGIAISNGDKFLSYTDAVSQEIIPYGGTSYPLGNAFWIAFWIKLFGLKHVYIGSLFSAIFSLYLIYKILAKENFSKLAVLLLFVYPSLAFFSNSLMSSMPSFLIVSTFLYGLFHFDDSGKKWFLLSFTAALSFWVRETNLVLLASICLIHFFQDRRWFFYYVSGAILGFLPRILTSYYYYGDPFHYVLAEGFSIQNFIGNAGVYGIILLCFMPLGLWFIGKYRGRYYSSILISTFMFILMYSFYSFNATEYSGFNKGVILMGRFMIPVLPIFVLAVGWYFRKKTIPKSLKILATVLVCVLIISIQALVYKEANVHKNISNHIYSKYMDKMVMFDLSRTTNIVRYINPFHGKLTDIGDISNLKDDIYMHKLFNIRPEAYLIQTVSSAHADKVKYTSKIDGIINVAKSKYNIIEVENIKIKPMLYLQVFKINKKDGAER